MNLIFWVIGAALIALIFLFIKIRYLKHKLFWIAILIAGLFLYITFMMSIAGKNVDLNSMDGIKNAGKIYLLWLTNAFGNMRSLTGNAIKQDWQINATLPGR